MIKQFSNSRLDGWTANSGCLCLGVGDTAHDVTVVVNGNAQLPENLSDMIFNSPILLDVP